MRIAVLWGGLSGYLDACLQELASRPGVQLFVAHTGVNEQAPFGKDLFAWIKDAVEWRSANDYARLHARLTAFSPEVILVAGWHVKTYRRLMKPLKNRCVRIMAIDNTWNATLKQRLGILVSPIYVRSLAEAMWVPGQRQAVFAIKLGFPVRRIVQGLYCCDFSAFASVYQRRAAANTSLPKAFLFVGRLVEEKGIRTMVDAYANYRAAVETPWPLIVCGTGPLRSLLEGKPGVQLLGFVQPAELPRIMSTTACLVLPSAFEPWALVVNEATAAGLMVIATENVGSVPHLVRNYYNGFTVGVADPDGLTETMVKVSTMDVAQSEMMSQKSHELSQQYTPESWANTLITLASDLRVGQRT